MNCTECESLITVFLDRELDEVRAGEMRAHLAECVRCARVCADLSAILETCRSGVPDEIVPPNSRALWCRINNIIESEAKPAPQPAPEGGRRFWRLSLAQLSAAVLGIALISSLLTVVAIRNYTRPPEADLVTRSAATMTPFEEVMARLGLMESPHEARERRLREQQAAIDYWNARVQARRLQWDRTTRDAFDRNLRVIDESVHEYTMILQQNPEDELSGEMLDAVLTEKMNLLRDFSDL